MSNSDLSCMAQNPYCSPVHHVINYLSTNHVLFNRVGGKKIIFVYFTCLVEDFKYFRSVKGLSVFYWHAGQSCANYLPKIVLIYLWGLFNNMKVDLIMLYKLRSYSINELFTYRVLVLESEMEFWTRWTSFQEP